MTLVTKQEDRRIIISEKLVKNTNITEESLLQFDLYSLKRRND